MFGVADNPRQLSYDSIEISAVRTLIPSSFRTEDDCAMATLYSREAISPKSDR